MPKTFAVGDIVSPKISQTMRYSGYGGTPDYTIVAGSHGRVLMIDIVPVHGNSRSNLILVEFDPIVHPHTGTVVRVEQAYYPRELTFVRRGTVSIPD